MELLRFISRFIVSPKRHRDVEPNKTMKILVKDDAVPHVVSYPFRLGPWLTAEVRRCVTSSKAFEKKYGKYWTLRITLFTNTRAKTLCLHDLSIYKKSVCCMAHVPYIGASWAEPAAYAQPVRQWLEGIAMILRKCHLDSSGFEQRIPALLEEFCSDRSRIVPEWVEAPKPVPTGLPKWRVPRDLKKRASAAGGGWQDDRYDPLLLTVNAATADDDDVGDPPLIWQIEFDPFDERLEAARERLERRGVEPDADGWSSAIQKAFRKRFPRLARELQDDSESSTCVLYVESEKACKALVELVWSMFFKK